MMHEGTICREIVEIISNAAMEHHIQKVYEIILSVGPYSCIHERQLNFYFEIMREGTCMDEAIIKVERDDTLQGASQMYIKTFRGE